MQKVNTGTEVRVKLYSEYSSGIERFWWMRPCTVVHVYDGGYTETRPRPAGEPRS